MTESCDKSVACVSAARLVRLILIVSSVAVSPGPAVCRAGAGFEVEVPAGFCGPLRLNDGRLEQ